LGRLDPRQVAIWRAMSPVRRLELAFQAYQLALDAALAVGPVGSATPTGRPTSWPGG
jgi:hypothetical protein